VPAVLSIDPRSGIPIYLQLIEQVKRSVALGALSGGEQLPTVKQLASDLVINPNTVARAYRELERDGIIETAAGRGSFVRRHDSVNGAHSAAADVARHGFDGAVREAKSLGLGREDTRKLFQSALDRWLPEDR
jgi:GntR family transcriptional regulator